MFQRKVTVLTKLYLVLTNEQQTLTQYVRVEGKRHDAASARWCFLKRISRTLDSVTDTSTTKE